MDRAVTLNWLEMRQLAADKGMATRPVPGLDRSSENARLAQENGRLLQENERLRRRCGELTASAETWIRLYERALARANAADGRHAAPDAAGAAGEGPRG